MKPRRVRLALTALANVKAEPPAVGSGFLVFNLVRIERHGTVSHMHDGRKAPDVRGLLKGTGRSITSFLPIHARVQTIASDI